VFACYFSACVAFSFIVPGCGSAKAPTSPTLPDISGTWSGTSSYPNAPFQLILTQNGASLTGRYTDSSETDTAVTGLYLEPIPGGTASMSVHSGDGRLIIDGAVRRQNPLTTIEGNMTLSQNKVSQSYPVTLTR
jgi:hypothetical protein